jgi:predicted metal-binding membrane protein
VTSIPRSRTAELAPAAALLLIAAICWVVAIDRMDGMGPAPGAMNAMGMSMGSMHGAGSAMASVRDLGAFSFFLPTWIVMMAAMMLPSAVPPVARRGISATALFAAEYIVVWTVLGIAAFGVARAVGLKDAGSAVVATVLVAAALYELTPFKRARLTRCSESGERRSGLAYGLDCAGCCAGIMVALLAVGAMSVTWMIVAAVAIAIEKLRPVATVLIAVGLVGLAAWAAAGSLPA